MNLKINAKNIAAALALGMAGAPQAHAVAMYAADALVQVTLMNVNGGTLGSDVFVTYENAVTGLTAISSGLTSFAVADPYVFPGQPTQDMPVLDTLEHDHIAQGEAGQSYGSAYSSTQSAGSIFLDNPSAIPVDFQFEYSILGKVSIGMTGSPHFADAFAEAVFEIFDDTFNFVDIYESLGASLATGVTSQELDLQRRIFTITVGAGDFNNLSVLVDTNGGATFVVPEPGTLALLAAGFLGFATRRSPSYA